MYTKVCIHITREQWKCHSEQTSQDRVRSESGGSIDGICIDEIIHDSKEDEDHTESKRGSRGDGRYPMYAWRVRPREPEETDGQGAGSYHGHGKTGFWWCVAIVGSCDSFVSFVITETVDDGEEHAYCHAEESKTADTWRPAALLLIDDGEGGE